MLGKNPKPADRPKHLTSHNGFFVVNAEQAAMFARVGLITMAWSSDTRAD